MNSDGDSHGGDAGDGGDGVDDRVLSRAMGALVGALAGDSLGAQVEFRSAASIKQEFPQGVRSMDASPVWGTLAGQPTDDGELTLALARVLVERGFDIERIAESYADWRASGPFDCGATIGAATSAMLAARRAGKSIADAARAATTPASQSNGSLMRQSPLAIWGCHLPEEELSRVVEQDTLLTHSSFVCLDASGAYAAALAAAIRDGLDGGQTYKVACRWQERHGKSEVVAAALKQALHEKPGYEQHIGWVCVGLQNAFYQALHAPNFEEGVVDSVAGGGETDTNAAIAGALLGAVHGVSGTAGIPKRWLTVVLRCQPQEGVAGVRHPRPERYWPANAIDLACELVEAGERSLPPSR